MFSLLPHLWWNKVVCDIIVYRTAPFTMTLNELRCHSQISSLLKCVFIHLWQQLSRPTVAHALFVSYRCFLSQQSNSTRCITVRIVKLSVRCIRLSTYGDWAFPGFATHVYGTSCHSMSSLHRLFLYSALVTRLKTPILVSVTRNIYVVPARSDFCH